MYQVSIKEKSKLGFITTRMEVPALAREEGSPLTTRCQFTPKQPHQLQPHPPPSSPSILRADVCGVALAASRVEVEVQGGRNRGCCIPGGVSPGAWSLVWGTAGSWAGLQKSRSKVGVRNAQCLAWQRFPLFGRLHMNIRRSPSPDWSILKKEKNPSNPPNHPFILLKDIGKSPARDQTCLQSSSSGASVTGYGCSSKPRLPR